MINVKDYHNSTEKKALIKKAETIKNKAIQKEEKILKITLKTIHSTN